MLDLTRGVESGGRVDVPATFLRRLLEVNELTQPSNGAADRWPHA